MPNVASPNRTTSALASGVQPVSTGRSAAVAVVAAQPASNPTSIAITLTQAPPPSLALWANGTVLVAFFALLGVAITVFAAHKRMRAELDAAATRARAERDQSREEAQRDRDHASNESHAERIASARRETYIEALEGFTRAQQFIANLANLDLADLDYQKHVGPLANAVAKIALVGEMQTVAQARRLFSCLHQQFFDAMAFLMPDGHHKADIQRAEREWSAAQLEIQRILSAMRNYNETAKKDPAVFAALSQSFEAEQQRAARAANEAQAARLADVEVKKRYGSLRVSKASGISALLDELVYGIRTELGVKTDFAALRAQSQEIEREAQAAYTKLMSKIGRPEDNAP